MISKNFLPYLIFSILFLTKCTPDNKPTTNNGTSTYESLEIDQHSFAKSDAITKHLKLNLTADFDKKTLTGFAKYKIQNQNATKIIFDTKDLNITSVTLERDQKTGFKLGKKDDHMGQPLIVDILPTTKEVTIYYSTVPTSEAVQWLTPQQTADKRHPFLFTQGQAILTRTWIPCQDSPGIRMTYDADIAVPKDLMAVMSASNPTEKSADGKYHFEMKQPIPPYLIAMAIGDLEFGKIGAHTGIYAEPSMLKAALYEFGDTEKMLVAAEEMYGEYLWDRYDIIVLPPSFPFGGMENPRLTFATPTVIAGDRSLTSLIAHELAHSWSGNLVTNATWNDFWLNEGFTVYFERRIMEKLYGAEYAEMLSLLGFQDLEADVADLESHDTHLHLNLKGRNPDDGMTDVAYEKGYFFLKLLEQEVGREKFDAWLSNYFKEHAFKTINTKQFIEYLTESLISPNNIEVDIAEWVYGPGIPNNCPKVTSNRFNLVDAAVEQVEVKSATSIKTNKWSPHEWLHFIRHLPTDLSQSKMKEIDNTFTFSKSTNSEIQAAWYELSIKNGYFENNLKEIEAFLIKVGRRKFLTPLYRAFKESGNLEIGQKIYAKAKPNYHAISTTTMDALLEVQ